METFYTSDRAAWRQYLAEHFETAEEVWFVFPTKEAGEASLSELFRALSAHPHRL